MVWKSQKYHLCKVIFLYIFSTLKDVIQTQYKINQWISYILTITCLKGISDEWLSFSVNVNASVKVLCALGRLSKGTQAAGYVEGTWALGRVSRSFSPFDT